MSRPPRPGTWPAAWRLAMTMPKAFAAGMLSWGLFHILPLLGAPLLKAVLDRLEAGPATAGRALPWVVALAGAEILRAADHYVAARVWVDGWCGFATHLRRNMLAGVVFGPGAVASRLPATSGDTTNRMRDDVEDFIWFIDTWLDTWGSAVFSAVALAVMFRIDPVVTAVGVLPLLTVTLITRLLSSRIQAWRRQLRESTGTVTGLIAEAFSAVLAVKGAGSGPAVVARVRAAGGARRQAALRDQLGTDLLQVLNASTVDLATGVVLLLTASSLREGEFSVGDLGLFIVYLGYVASTPAWFGRLMARHRQAGVSLERMASLHADGDSSTLVVGGPFDPQPARPADRPPLPARLEVRGLTALHPSSGRGVEGVDLVVGPGQLVAVTGPIGTGKTTLLRAVLGLHPRVAGEISWGGAVLDDPAQTLVPPVCAYVPQVPRLFSDTLAANIAQGTAFGPEAIADALATAALADDVAAMPDGTGTLIGPRGARLSGGQIQRAAAARAFVHRPALLVLDDLSSALDAATEDRLYDALLQPGHGSLLVVTHRPAVLERADHVLRLSAPRSAAVASR